MFSSRVRRARRDDAEAVSRLILSLSHYYLQRPDHIGGQEQREERTELPAGLADAFSVKALQQQFENPEFLNLVYCAAEEKGKGQEKAGEVLGLIAIAHGDYLQHLFVAEHAQGKGIATKLWHQAESETGAIIYRLRASLNSVSFYQRQGFRKDGEVQQKSGVYFQPMIYQRRNEQSLAMTMVTALLAFVLLSMSGAILLNLKSHPVPSLAGLSISAMFVVALLEVEFQRLAAILKRKLWQATALVVCFSFTLEFSPLLFVLGYSPALFFWLRLIWRVRQQLDNPVFE